MRVHPPPADLVSAGFREPGPAEAAQKGARGHNAAAEGGAFTDELLAVSVRCIDFVGNERV